MQIQNTRHHFSTFISTSNWYIINCKNLGCSGLTYLTVDENNTALSDGNGSNCIINTSTNQLIAGCTNTIIPSTVTSIGLGAFFSRTGLTSITIPSSVTYINEEAFCDCPNLSSIVVESGNTKYDCRENCNAIIETSSNTLVAGCKNTVIPNTITQIGNYAFYGCSGLTSITIPNNVTSIGTMGFYGTGITSVTIPYNVETVHPWAFDNCSNLKNVTFNSIIDINGIFGNFLPTEASMSLTDDSYVCSSYEWLPILTSPATFTRTMKNQWGTIVLPFNVTISDNPTCDFYELQSVTSTTLTLQKKTGTLNAGTPAIIRMGGVTKNSEGKYDLTLTAASTDLDITINNPDAVSGLTITGTYATKNISSESGYVINSNAFHSIASIKSAKGYDVYCAPFHAYLAGTVSNAKELNIVCSDGEDVNAIEAIEALNSDNAQYFDANGRRVADLQNGVNIVRLANGKTMKVIIK